MLVKFEHKSSRVKGIAFHSKRPLVIVSLHTGSVQLWDYRMGTLIERFSDHEGPVRAIAFHPSQPLFASGGDDGKIRVYNYQQKKCLFTLSGHQDYIRTIQFHHQNPWIVTASDDQTVRVWNWQSRECVSVLTGHGHYVMCAQFHPSEELIVSASLDQSVRVWDVSGIGRRRGSSQINSPTAVDASFTHKGIDLFSAPEGQVKYVLEGHDRGVNWVQFHPSKPLIVSCSDDRSIKLWRYNDLRAWETDTFRGHHNNVSSVAFHPSSDLIISNGEDKTVRIWDYTKRSGSRAPIIHRREKDRFWAVAVHPTDNLIACAHDSGWFVFKCEHERPVYCNLKEMRDSHSSSSLLLGKDRVSVSMVWEESSLAIATLPAPANTRSTISVSEPDQCALISNNPETAKASAPPTYQLFSLNPARNDGGGGAAVKSGSGSFATFFARNRFAVLLKNAENKDGSSSSIQVKACDNTILKSIPVSDRVLKILPGPPASHHSNSGSNAATAHFVLAVEANRVYFLDCNQQPQQHEPLSDKEGDGALDSVAIEGVKYADWSPDGRQCALSGKRTITIIAPEYRHHPGKDDGEALPTPIPRIVHQIKESVNIKSVYWQSGGGILFYTNSHHLKYSLPNGDQGIICTLAYPLYLQAISEDGQVSCFDRDAATLQSFCIDLTEPLFKLALLRGDRSQIIATIESSPLIGQSIISYLRKSGYPEIALGFVQDPLTRFQLAIECCDFDVAWEEALSLNNSNAWTKLADEALAIGKFGIAKKCFLKIGDWSRLSFLYLICGDVEELARLTDQERAPTGAADEDENDCEELPLECRLMNQIYLGQTHKISETLTRSLNSNGAASIDSSTQMAGRLSIPQPLDASFEDWPLTGDPIAARVHLKRQPSQLFENVQQRCSTADLSGTSPAKDTQKQADSSNAFSTFAAKEGFGDGGWDVDDVVGSDDGDDAFADYKTAATTANGGEEASKLHLAIGDFVDENGELPAAFGDDKNDSLQQLGDEKSIVHQAVTGDWRGLAIHLQENYKINLSSPTVKAAIEPFIIRALQGSLIVNCCFDGRTVLVALLAESSHRHHASKEDGAGNPQTNAIFTASDIFQNSVKSALSLTTRGKFEEAIQIFTDALYATLFVDSSGRSGADDDRLGEVEEEQEQIREIKQMCSVYLLGLRMEMKKRKCLANECEGGEEAALSLALYFASLPLQPEHGALATRSALTLAHKLKCPRLAGKLANVLLATAAAATNSPHAVSEKTREQAEKIVMISERLPINHKDPINVASIEDGMCIDARGLAPVVADACRICVFCGASNRLDGGAVDALCAICKISTL